MSGLIFWAVAYIFRNEIKKYIRDCLKEGEKNE
jgi:hypothetical protein